MDIERSKRLQGLKEMGKKDVFAAPTTPIPPGLGPSFLRALADPDTKRILFVGVGGGFDFVHSGLLVPHVKQLQKEIFFLSYSFGAPSNLGGNAEVIDWSSPKLHEEVTADDVILKKRLPLVKKVTAASKGPPNYQPEIGYCAFLDQEFPGNAPHFMYACYARDFVPKQLTELYKYVVDQHDIDTLLMFDGGTDSLMRGDESGLGDPIEDACSILAASKLRTLRHKFLISIGFGADRFNGVSDGASLRAVAELTKLGAFRGSFGVEPNDPGRIFYENLLEQIYSQQSFRSVLSSLILASAKGEYGKIVPEHSGSRVKEGEAYVWPLMCMLFAFEVDLVVSRSLICKWIAEAESPHHAHYLLMQGRHSVVILNEEKAE